MYEILQFSLCEGWINNLSDGEGHLYTFPTLEEAIAELQGEFDDWAFEIRSGERDKDDGYDVCTFQIRCIATGMLYELDEIEGKISVSN